jgi:hypothetical protein
MLLAIYERLYQFNFHLIEARRVLQELGLALRIDEVEEFCRIRWNLDEARREADRRCCAQMEGIEARERGGLYPRELDPDEAVVREFQSGGSEPGT